MERDNGLGSRIDVSQTEVPSANTLLKPPTVVEQSRWTGMDRFIYYSTILPASVVCTIGGKYILDHLEQARESIMANPELFRYTVAPYESTVAMGIVGLTLGAIFIGGAAADLAAGVNRRLRRQE